MIYPAMRLSELRADRDARREAFEKSRSTFIASAQKTLQPVFLIRRYYKTIFGTLITVGSVSRLLRAFRKPKRARAAAADAAPKRKAGMLGSLGWLPKAAVMMSPLLKRAAPFLIRRAIRAFAK